MQYPVVSFGHGSVSKSSASATRASKKKKVVPSFMVKASLWIVRLRIRLIRVFMSSIEGRVLS